METDVAGRMGGMFSESWWSGSAGRGGALETEEWIQGCISPFHELGSRTSDKLAIYQLGMGTPNSDCGFWHGEHPGEFQGQQQGGGARQRGRARWERNGRHNRWTSMPQQKIFILNVTEKHSKGMLWGRRVVCNDLCFYSLTTVCLNLTNTLYGEGNHGGEG